MAKNDAADAPVRKTYDLDRTVRLVIGVTITVCILLLVRRLSSVLLPFFGAWVIAYILEPVVGLNQQMMRTRKRMLPVVATLLEIAIVIVVLGFLLAPSISREIAQIQELMRAYAENPDSEGTLSASATRFINEHFDLGALTNRMTGSDWSSLFDAIISFVATSIALVTGIFGWFLTLVYLFFIMIEYDRMHQGLMALIPAKGKAAAQSVLGYLKDNIGRYFRGQSLVCLIVGVLFSIGFLIIGMPIAIVFGLFIGLLNMVPYLQLASIPIASLLCLMHTMETGGHYWPYWGECMLVYIVVQVLQDMVVTPRIMGRAMNLSPAVIFLSLSVWGSLLGFVGLVIGLPLTAILTGLYKEYVLHEHPHIPTKKNDKKNAKITDDTEPLKA